MARFAAVILATLSCLGAQSWKSAVPGYRFEFPRDHFSHPDFRTEWWYYTGNLRARDGHTYGFELVFFRQGERRGSSENPSAWRVDDLYLAHLALTDIDGRRFRYYERVNRAGPGIAGASLDAGRIWNGNWAAEWNLGAGAQTLTALAEGIRFTLRLTPRKPPVIHGENGVSQTAEGEGKASYYVSFTRLAVEGELNGAPVSGLAWMDHEWFTNMLLRTSADGTGSARSWKTGPISWSSNCAGTTAAPARTRRGPTWRPMAAPPTWRAPISSSGPWSTGTAPKRARATR
ncbi:MAG: carotenoid 1,2-hydratase [Acidobacteriia bacterium]|nr:carotenoid 1,2-hydratase [Terriglobia bacterium]